MRPTTIAVLGGCGHVGLPLALKFAEKGHDVTIVDIDAAAVEAIARGEMPFLERDAAPLLRAHVGNNLRATTDPSAVSGAEVVVCIVGTPIDEHLNPQVEKLVGLIHDLGPHLRAGQLFVLRSTVYPGATAHLARVLDERAPGIDVAFCPERVAQGHALREFEELPQLVSGVTPRARERARDLFGCMTDKLVEVEPLEAELGKLFCNSWRYIVFAAANQFYSLCVSHGIDFYRVWGAITQDYPRLAGFPRAGFAAGPCLFKDTMQLAAFYNNEFTLGQSAMLVNEGLPRVLVQHLREAAAPLRERTVGILGMTFKGDNDDTRESLAFKLRKLLALECRAVLCTDELARGAWWRSLDEVLAQADVLVIGAPHARYRALTPRQRVLDPWNLLGRGGLLA
ncbi:MAG: nucleotide sugar dehydrogenase [Planctomycetes bacterium]|nr:nucleotide sugar dehydrogenase [Planctomycetota bacterium]